MRMGTKSILYGAHCFFLHPFFVAAGWWRLYGVPWAPWLWLAFLVHDLGYIGKTDMDGAEGEQHPWLGARIMYWVQGAWLFLRREVWLWSDPRLRVRPLRWWHMRRKWARAHLRVARERVIWGNEVLFHSRFLARQYGAAPSRLCYADKLAIVLTPTWLYLPMVRATGEIHEYMARTAAAGKYNKHATWTFRDEQGWLREMRAAVRAWLATENADA